MRCTGIVGHHEATAPEDIERCHNYNNTLTLNCDLYLTKMLLLSKVILVLISIFDIEGKCGVRVFQIKNLRLANIE